MSRDQIDRQLEREEERLSAAYDRGDLSREEYNAEMRLLQREAREAYREGLEEDMDRVRREWS